MMFPYEFRPHPAVVRIKGEVARHDDGEPVRLLPDWQAVYLKAGGQWDQVAWLIGAKLRFIKTDDELSHPVKLDVTKWVQEQTGQLDEVTAGPTVMEKRQNES